MKNFKWYLSFTGGVIILSIVYPWALMYPICIFGSMFVRMFQIAPYFFPNPPEYIIRLVGLLIGLICIAIILYLERREILRTKEATINQ